MLQNNKRSHLFLFLNFFVWLELWIIELKLHPAWVPNMQGGVCFFKQKMEDRPVHPNPESLKPSLGNVKCHAWWTPKRPESHTFESFGTVLHGVVYVWQIGISPCAVPIARIGSWFWGHLPAGRPACTGLRVVQDWPLPWHFIVKWWWSLHFSLSSQVTNARR